MYLNEELKIEVFVFFRIIDCDKWCNEFKNRYIGLIVKKLI